MAARVVAPRAKLASGVTWLQEQFCQAYVGPAQGVLNDAWRLSHPDSTLAEKNISGEAQRIFRKPAVQSRIDALLANKRTIREALSPVTEGEVLQSIRQVLDLAVETGDLPTAAACNKQLGQTLGMFIERKRVEDERSARPLKDYTLEELLAESQALNSYIAYLANSASTTIREISQEVGKS